ncbi:hypothetical protein AVEN_125880-1 [Araneus ventricosus]|uniref:Uncharacterized protein n=1 Tax=Araneus ventricosus TaxID=182803 RepID=A0A4Y2F8C0_ARAVE|nr:hypothetical protein AVEN_125880-1 [Araneus ventricosus]
MSQLSRILDLLKLVRSEKCIGSDFNPVHPFNMDCGSLSKSLPVFIGYVLNCKRVHSSIVQGGGSPLSFSTVTKKCYRMQEEPRTSRCIVVEGLVFPCGAGCIVWHNSRGGGTLYPPITLHLPKIHSSLFVYLVWREGPKMS